MSGIATDSDAEQLFRQGYPGLWKLCGDMAADLPIRPCKAAKATYNRSLLQENTLEGGLVRRSASNGLTRTRRISAIGEDVRLNSALWERAIVLAA